MTGIVTCIEEWLEAPIGFGCMTVFLLCNEQFSWDAFVAAMVFRLSMRE